MSDSSNIHNDASASDEMISRLSEAILANLMVFDTVDIPREQVKQLLARDGVALVGGGLELRIPISPKLSDETGRKLFDSYTALLEDYDAGRLSTERLQDIRSQNNVDHKIAAFRKSKSKLN
jgi:hypothetical protein